ncbi:MAG: protein kinase [Myxococcaceae bacterium]|nr:protein kinase [Myxococcaceae bacterium]
MMSPRDRRQTEASEGWAPGVAVGKYVLVAPLAKGGMAEIWLARPLTPSPLAAPMVVKRILSRDASDEEYVRMFLDEARIASQLSHPNIVRIIELDVAQGRYFLAMEYLHGETLSHVVRSATSRGFALPLPMVVHFVAEAAAGLGYAHSRTNHWGQSLGIVHRDVSPQNLLITYDGEVKVLDFGIAKALQRSSKTQKGVVKGKTAYMAPEQARAEPVDARADVFSLGVVLFEAVTGTRLHGDMDDPAIVARLLSSQPLPSARVRNPAVPPDLDALIARALHYTPAARYADAQAFHLALRDWLKTYPAGTPTAQDAGTLMHQLFEERIAMRRELLAGAAPPALPEVDDGPRKHPAPKWKRPLLQTLALFSVGFTAVLYGLLHTESTPMPVQVRLPVSVNFPPAAGPAQVPAVVIKPPPDSATPEPLAPPSRLPTTPSSTGKLSLETEPWTQVYLGKKRLGDTPLVEKKLPVGRHTLRLLNESEGIDTRIEVIIKSDEVTTKSLNL